MKGFIEVTAENGTHLLNVRSKERIKAMAIKIIKPGKKPETFRSECPHCGCVFEADEDDYEYEFGSLNGCYCYAADCPTCGLTVRKPDDE